MNTFVFWLLVFVELGCSLERPELTIHQGTLIGKYTETISKRKISAFLGIPYARPVTGKHRFKESISALPWKGKLNAINFANDCMQYSHFIQQASFKVTGSEDCLYLNVFTPKTSFDMPTINLIDVIVFIHGGAFMVHGSSYYGPEYLLDNDVILVTLNYRLGPLGFLSTEDMVLPGNNGLKDQVLALKWVQKNIQYFGGDPNRVTIAGMSAGGASVHYHLISPRSKGLFNHAIILSGSAFCPWAQTEKSKEKAALLANELECPINDTNIMVKCLRERPAEQIVHLSSLFLFWLFLPFSPFGPVVEAKSPTAFIDAPPSQIIVNKLANDVPLLISFTADEGLFPGAEILSSEKYINYFNQNWDKIMPHLLDFNFTVPANDHTAISGLIRKKYTDHQDINKVQKRFIKMLSDRLFNIPIAQTARIHSMYYTSPVYVYKFSYQHPISVSKFFWPANNYKGTCHGDDISYILKSKSVPVEKNPDALSLFKKMTGIWTTFIKDGPFPEIWLPVKESLPVFSFLEISGAQSQTDKFIQEADFGEESFWKSLNINEDNKFFVRIQDEL